MIKKKTKKKRKIVKRNVVKRKVVKRKVVKRKVVKRKVVKRKAIKTKTKKPFGGYAINFKNRNETLEQIFGKTAIPPSQMTKKLWKFVKVKRLGHK